jgi:hypothetical protein
MKLSGEATRCRLYKFLDFKERVKLYDPEKPCLIRVSEESDAAVVVFQPHCDTEMDDATKGTRIKKGDRAQIDGHALHVLSWTKRGRNGCARGEVEFALECDRW